MRHLQEWVRDKSEYYYSLAWMLIHFVWIPKWEFMKNCAYLVYSLLVYLSIYTVCTLFSIQNYEFVSLPHCGYLVKKIHFTHVVFSKGTHSKVFIVKYCSGKNIANYSHEKITRNNLSVLLRFQLYWYFYDL